MNVKCEIYRFDPASGAGEEYETYFLEAEPLETVLDILYGYIALLSLH